MLLATMVDQVLLTHWAHRIEARRNPQNEDIIVFLNIMEEIINDVPPSYQQLGDLVEYQIDYLIDILAGEWKTYAQWLWHNWNFETLSEFCTRIREQHGEMYKEAMDEMAQEIATIEESDIDEDAIEINSHKKS